MTDSHAIRVDLERVLPLLAKDIYNTPYAFLRENVQNAIDAVRIQAYRERSAGYKPSAHEIDVSINGLTVAIRDTGIGMSRSDLELNYWSIGHSGKGTSEAREARVVGTFGIGGMANFGVCSHVSIVTRSEHSSVAVQSDAERSELSTDKECVFYKTLD